MSPRLSAIAMIVGCLAVSGCAASESVTISDTAVVAATATAPDTAQPTAIVDDISEPTVAEVAGEPTAAPATSDPTPAPTSGARSQLSGSEGCRFDSIDDFDDIQIELAFTSTESVQDDMLLNYVLFDGNGDEIATSSSYIEDLKPGEQVLMKIDTVEGAPTSAAARAGITCEFLGTQPLGFGAAPFRPQPGDSCTFVEVDSFDDIQLKIDVANPATEAGELIIDFALRGPNGVRFGDGSEFSAVVDPGERIVIDTDSLTELPEWVDEASFSCEILSIEQF